MGLVFNTLDDDKIQENFNPGEISCYMVLGIVC